MVSSKANGKPKGGKGEQMAANTLLGWFKDGLRREGCSTKHFNRAFLAEYVHAYNEIKRQVDTDSVAYYEKPDGTVTAEAWLPVHETRFYKENGTSYCVFLELWNEYKDMMSRFHRAGF